MTLRSTDDSALDILALECSAEEPARILTLLCQKIASNPATSAGSLSTSPASTSDAGSISSGSSNGLVRSASSKHKKSSPEASTATVSVQSWSDREKMLDALIDEHKPAVSAQNIIRQLERQHSEWNLIQRRTEDGLTHLQVSSPQQMKHRQQQHQQSGHNKAATTSGGVLKKAMPSGSSLGHSGRTQQQETEHHLAITNSHQSSGSRSSGVSVNGVVLVSSDVKATHHHHPPGLKRSDTTMHQKLVGTSKPINGHLTKKNASASCILSLQTPELPLPTVANASTSTADAPVPPPTKSRWSFGAPFRSSPASTVVQRRQLSPEVPRRSEKQQQRGRSCDRKSSKTVSSAATAKVTTPAHSDLANLFIASSGFNKKKTDQRLAEASASTQPTKIKRDPSKTRSFLMKLTSSSRKSPTPPVSPPASILSLNDGRSAQRTATDVDGGGRQRGRSLVRLRSSARFQSPPPPPPSSSIQQQTAVSQTFLIPTKSGQELTRHIYPKETSCRSVNGSAPQQPPPPPPPQPVFHLLAGGGRASHRYNGPVTGPSGWAGYCWPGEMAGNGTTGGVGGLRHPPPYSDTNNNQPQQQQQQWIYFHPHHHGVSAAAIKASNDLKRIQRSRSQSPGRRNSQRMAMASAPSSLVISPLIDMHPPPRWLAPPPVAHYYAVPTTTAQPVSLPPDVSHLARETPPSRSFRRSKSSTRLSARQSKSDRHHGSSSNIGSSTDRLSGSSNNKAVTFHAFATVQLVD